MIDASSTDYLAKRARLFDELRSLERVAIAYSGGVDSSVLLHAATEALGRATWVRDGTSPHARGAAGVIADSPSLPRRELAEAIELARAHDLVLHVVSTDELDDERYRANRGDRCYFCKSALFAAMGPWARARDFAALAFGEIADDLLDDRPGARAAREVGVVAPLSSAGFAKEDVRRYAREAGLAVADKPASACLASRLPVGTRVTRERLERVERCEELVRARGFRVLRVRDLGSRARLEVGADELARARGLEAEIARSLAVEGFVELELAVYRRPASSDSDPTR